MTDGRPLLWVLLCLLMCAVMIFAIIQANLMLPAGGRVPNEKARLHAHITIPRAIEEAASRATWDQGDSEKVEAYLRDPEHRYSTDYTYAVGERRGNIIPVTVYVHERKSRLELTPISQDGWGMACVEYKVQPVWEVVDVTCGREARRELREWEKATSDY